MTNRERVRLHDQPDEIFMLMQTQDIPKSAHKPNSEFAPLELARALELKRLINLAAKNQAAVVIEPTQGVTDAVVVNLISPIEKTNALVRFHRHY
jgi:hypothetical protein